MIKTKKLSISFITALLLFTIYSLKTTVLAKESTLNHGTYEDVIEYPNFGNLSDDEKSFIVDSLLPGEKIVYETTEEHYYKFQEDGSLLEIPNTGTPFATIPSSDLTVSSDIYDSTITNKGKRVYANFKWNKTLDNVFTPGTDGDKISIAVPSGWDITASSYGCNEYSSGNNSSWVYQNDCGGRPYDLGYSGAVWSLTQSTKVWHKGTATLRMERTSTSAQNKVIGQYVRDTGNSTTWTIGYGPASISITGNKSTDKVSWDTAFTY